MPTYPTIVTESGADTFAESDWKEFVAPVDASGPDILAIDSGEATLTGYIPANKARSAMTFFRGYAFSNDGKNLYRHNPVRHPVWPWLWCTNAHFHRQNPIGNAAGTPAGSPNVPSAVSGSLSKTTKYLQCKVTLTFAPVGYQIYDDSDTAWNGKEYSRNCVIWDQTDPSLDTISGVNGTLKFVEGAPAGKSFQGETATYLTKTELTLLWVGVPELYTHDGGYPRRILERQGTTNLTDFMGFPRGTLLLHPPKFRRYQQPVWTTGGQLWANDISLVMTHFDPEPGVGYGNSIYRGHQLLPWLYGGGQSGGAGWFSVEREDDSLLLAESEYAGLFLGVQDPNP